MPCRLPEAGDVVEYPLSEHVQRELMDGRTHGVGLLVGRCSCPSTDVRYCLCMRSKVLSGSTNKH